MSQTISIIPLTKDTFSGNTFTLISILETTYKKYSKTKKITRNKSIKDNIWVLEK